MRLSVFDEAPAGLETRDAHEIGGLLDGPSLIRLNGGGERPLFISALLHGNETTSWDVARELISRARTGSLEKPILLFVGNIPAAAAKNAISPVSSTITASGPAAIVRNTVSPTRRFGSFARPARSRSSTFTTTPDATRSIAASTGLSRRIFILHRCFPTSPSITPTRRPRFQSPVRVLRRRLPLNAANPEIARVLAGRSVSSNRQWRRRRFTAISRTPAPVALSHARPRRA